MTPESVIDYWLTEIYNELKTIDLEKAKSQVRLIKDMLEYFTIDDTGIFAYLIVPDMKGNLMLGEMLFYIRKEHRGSLKLFKRYLDEAERIAVEKKCVSVKIGANMGYKDQKFIRVLQMFGYEVDAVTKEIKWH